MRIDELKKIAEENDYNLTDVYVFGEFRLSRRVDKHGDIINKITISKISEGVISIKNTWCDDKDLNMIKASIEFSETLPQDREEERKFYLKNRWENKQLTLKEIEAIKEKFNTDLTDFLLVEIEDD